MPRDDAALLFAGTSQAYATYRPGYPAALFDHMSAELAFTSHTRVADLGCGPGTASIPLAQRTGAVLALDPNPEMLQAARAAAQHAAVANIELRHGHAEHLSALDPGDIEHVVFGRSFHWTDRAAVVAMLDALLPAGGAIVLLGPGRSEKGAWHRWPWDEAIREVRESFLGPERRAGTGTYAHPEIGHEQVLAAGASPGSSGTPSPNRSSTTSSVSWGCSVRTPIPPSGSSQTAMRSTSKPCARR